MFSLVFPYRILLMFSAVFQYRIFLNSLGSFEDAAYSVSIMD